MSERGNFRGRGGGGGGRGGSERGRGGGARGGHTQGAEKPKKENILDLAKYMDKEIMVKFNGGRESELALLLFLGVCSARDERADLCASAIVQGTLKGHDQLMNLVLDDVQETLRGVFVPASTSPPPLHLPPSFSVVHLQCTLHLLTGTGFYR